MFECHRSVLKNFSCLLNVMTRHLPLLINMSGHYLLITSTRNPTTSDRYIQIKRITNFIPHLTLNSFKKQNKKTCRSELFTGSHLKKKIQLNLLRMCWGTIWASLPFDLGQKSQHKGKRQFTFFSLSIL